MRGAGGLDRRITIERYIEGARDEFNEAVEAWSAFAVIWAARKDVSDTEKVQSSQKSSALMSRFTIRNLGPIKSLNTKDRINYDGAVWSILGVKENGEGRNRFLEVLSVRESD